MSRSDFIKFPDLPSLSVFILFCFVSLASPCCRSSRCQYRLWAEKGLCLPPLSEGCSSTGELSLGLKRPTLLFADILYFPLLICPQTTRLHPGR